VKAPFLVVSSALLALSVAAAQTARAGSAPNASIQGTWALGMNTGDEGYTVAAGTLTFDGKGGVTGVLNEADDGTYCVGMTLGGSYTVNPGKLSGNAAMTVASVDTGSCGELGDGDTLTLAFYLSNNLKSFNYVEIDPDVETYLNFDFGAALAGSATHF
jgi:hypothetical protein